ncbi:MAG: aminomethyl-transferring glycine dehydrogenase subunit GcvPA [Nitrososphaeria archaeon]|nr:aminomethyl-transferring glycine dehydrogenase subunit GcvPA [Nitrososphaeria archaeon]
MTKFFKDYSREKLDKVLEKIGVKNVEELYSDVPDSIKIKGEVNLPKALDEIEVEEYFEKVLGKNIVHDEVLTFLGAGLPPHYVPAAVEAIVSRSEFYTAYTPYQPEISQGILQALFEYQSMVCELTGMDVANSSMYDWATGAAEALRMALRVKGKKKVLVGENIGPERKSVIRTYLEPLECDVLEVSYDSVSGRIDLVDLENKVKDSCALYIENPNFFGIIEKDALKMADIIHNEGGIFIVGIDPISLGLLKPPGEYGADIVVGEGQSLGGWLNFGGPSLGIFACKGDMTLVRQMPGRIIGMTTDLSGERRAFTMVLQTREQHIRREQATSNICTNEALMAVATVAYLALLGSRGLRKLAVEIFERAHYACRRLSEVKNVIAPYFSGEFYQEFTLKLIGGDINKFFNRVVDKKIIPGVILTRYFPKLDNVLLSCFTEVHTIEDIERLVETFKEVMA